ncbi:MAG: hypothetical protein HY062_01405 [Bacteroidetes bacterium]|nr:hypothetical protein [Bacteroidota bacterium]
MGNITISGIHSPNYNGDFQIQIDGILSIEKFRYVIKGTFKGAKTEYQGPGYANLIDNPNYYTGTFIINHQK